MAETEKKESGYSDELTAGFPSSAYFERSDKLLIDRIAGSRKRDDYSSIEFFHQEELPLAKLPETVFTFPTSPSTSILKISKLN